MQLAHADGSASFAISFNRAFAVDWPLEPIMLLPPGIPSRPRLTHDGRAGLRGSTGTLACVNRLKLPETA